VSTVNALRLPTLSLAILLAGCTTLKPVPIVAPCPEQPHPPESLHHRAESPQTEQRLIDSMRTITPPAPTTPKP